jgi:hypothetical protein
MTLTVILNEDGSLSLPANLFKTVQPHTRFTVKIHNDLLLLYPEGKIPPQLPLWATVTPEEQATSLLQWIDSIKEGPGLPDEATRRDSIYD